MFFLTAHVFLQLGTGLSNFRFLFAAFQHITAVFMFLFSEKNPPSRVNKALPGLVVHSGRVVFHIRIVIVNIQENMRQFDYVVVRIHYIAHFH
jgi:hypothetical protein